MSRRVQLLRAGLLALLLARLLLWPGQVALAATAPATGDGTTTTALLPGALWINVPGAALDFSTVDADLTQPGGALLRLGAGAAGAPSAAGDAAVHLRVRADTSKPWSLLLNSELRSLTRPGPPLSPNHLRYRVNGGEWLQCGGTPQVILSGLGPTSGWDDLNVEFQMQLNGNEAAGTYTVRLDYTALLLP